MYIHMYIYIYIHKLLTDLDERAICSGRVEGRNAGAARAQPLGEGALVVFGFGLVLVVVFVGGCLVWFRVCVDGGGVWSMD
jgi:hypothetical protein